MWCLFFIAITNTIPLLTNEVSGPSSEETSKSSRIIPFITFSNPLQLLSEEINLIKAAAINCAGSWRSAESLDKWAGRRNIVSYVEHKLSEGLDLLLVEEQECYQCDGSGATRLGIICLIIVPSLRCCITPKHSLVYLFPKQYRQTKQEFLEIESLPYLVEKWYFKNKHI